MTRESTSRGRVDGRDLEQQVDARLHVDRHRPAGDVQARIDLLLEIAPVDEPAGS